MRSVSINVTPSSVRVIRAATAGTTGKLGPNAVAISTKEAGDLIVDVWARDVEAFKQAISSNDQIRVRLTGNYYKNADDVDVISVRATFVSPTGGVDALVGETKSAEPALVGADD